MINTYQTAPQPHSKPTMKILQPSYILKNEKKNGKANLWPSFHYKFFKNLTWNINFITNLKHFKHHLTNLTEQPYDPTIIFKSLINIDHYISQ